jgi:hypothetical protein
VQVSVPAKVPTAAPVYVTVTADDVPTVSGSGTGATVYPAPPATQVSELAPPVVLKNNAAELLLGVVPTL